MIIDLLPMKCFRFTIFNLDFTNTPIFGIFWNNFRMEINAIDSKI